MLAGSPSAAPGVTVMRISLLLMVRAETGAPARFTRSSWLQPGGQSSCGNCVSSAMMPAISRMPAPTTMSARSDKQLRRQSGASISVASPRPTRTSVGGPEAFGTSSSDVPRNGSGMVMSPSLWKAAATVNILVLEAGRKRSSGRIETSSRPSSVITTRPKRAPSRPGCSRLVRARSLSEAQAETSSRARAEKRSRITQPKVSRRDRKRFAGVDWAFCW